MARKESKVIRQQKLAVGVFIGIAIAMAGYLSWVSLQTAPLGEFVEGEHYQIIENPRRIRSDDIEVLEIFSYACVHCYNFDPILEDWVSDQTGVNFIQMPAVASDYWRLLGRAYYALEALDVRQRHHMAFFRAIHESRLVFNTNEKLFDYFEGAGVDRAAFEAAFKSPEVAANIDRADKMARRLRVAAVPTVVVQGKYLVRTTGDIGPKRMLDVMNYLVERERQAINTAQ